MSKKTIYINLPNGQVTATLDVRVTFNTTEKKIAEIFGMGEEEQKNYSAQKELEILDLIGDLD